jgi:thiosulfate/3-mercaptopyruvate sulfurtransferase
MVDIYEAKDLIADPGGVLVSIRSWPEFIGETSGYSYIAPKGRIAGAVWGNAGSDAYSMGHYRNLDNTMRDYHEIEANWRDVGITPDKRVAFYCGTGWRASEAFFCAYLMGWEHIAIYDGGWLEWSQDESNPIERGKVGA